MRYHLVTAVIAALAAVGAMLLAGPVDEGPWPICQYEDGNPDGNECVWINEGSAYYVSSANYSLAGSR